MFSTLSSATASIVVFFFNLNCFVLPHSHTRAQTTTHKRTEREREKERLARFGEIPATQNRRTDFVPWILKGQTNFLRNASFRGIGNASDRLRTSRERSSQGVAAVNCCEIQDKPSLSSSRARAEWAEKRVKKETRHLLHWGPV